MNFIDNIEIKNFKSIRHQKIEGCKRVNVFIGYPNVGKSNILEAISLASNFNNSGKPISLKDLCRFEELIGLYNDGNKQLEIEIRVNDFIYSLYYDSPSLIKYMVNNRDFFTQDVHPDLLKTHKRLEINQNGNFTQIMIDSEVESPRVEIKKYQFKNIQNYQRNNPLKLDFPTGNNLFEVLRFNGGLRKDCGGLFTDYDLKLLFDEDANLKILKQIDEFSIFSIPMIQISDTLQRLIFYKAAITTNQDSILLFEEPEAHMFPPYISKFTGDVIYNENNNQFFITTHSPFVLNDLLDNAENNDLSVYVVSYKKDTGETLIHRMNESDKQEAYQFGYDFFMNINQFIPQETHG